MYSHIKKYLLQGKQTEGILLYPCLNKNIVSLLLYFLDNRSLTYILPGEKFEFSLLMHEINVLTRLNYPGL